MYYVYLLYSSEFDRYYIGSTSDPERRLAAHVAGRVKSTKAFRPWERIWMEELPDRSSAVRRERYYKSGWGRKALFKKLESEGWLSGLRQRS